MGGTISCRLIERSKRMADLEQEKALAARRAVVEVKDGMLIGLGTGSTAAYAVREVARRIHEEGLKITATATSKATEALATSLGISMVSFDTLARVDLTIDGADEIDPQLRAIKGGGGALLREKVVAAASDREIIVVDSSKPVATLGHFRLPVEVLPFAAAYVEAVIATFGVPFARRLKPDGQVFLTDQGAFIYDIGFGAIPDPVTLAHTLETIPGIIGHGLFLDQIDMVVIARGADLEILNRLTKAHDMPQTDLEMPFQPIRNSMYSSQELMDAFDPADVDSYVRTLDFRSYRYYVAKGGVAVVDPYAGMMEAVHDNSILRAMTVFLQQIKRPVVAIMGGHSETRDTPNYAAVVDIARKLTQKGCLVASGGGPGAMEATHLGALLANAPDPDVATALAKLKVQPILPDSKEVVAKDGTIDQAIARKLHTWATPAYEIGKAYMSTGGESLAVPTWYYGSEPISPLASHVAKYFQNSIREDVLLALAANGIIYTPGAAGTLQEVFQDAAQNFYRKKEELFAPMIFFGKTFWTDKLPVLPVLKALFVGNGKLTPEQFETFVTIVDTVDEAVDKLIGHGPSIAKMENRMSALGFGPIMNNAVFQRLGGARLE